MKDIKRKPPLPTKTSWILIHSCCKDNVDSYPRYFWHLIAVENILIQYTYICTGRQNVPWIIIHPFSWVRILAVKSYMSDVTVLVFCQLVVKGIKRKPTLLTKTWWVFIHSCEIHCGLLSTLFATSIMDYYPWLLQKTLWIIIHACCQWHRGLLSMLTLNNIMDNILHPKQRWPDSLTATHLSWA